MSLIKQTIHGSVFILNQDSLKKECIDGSGTKIWSGVSLYKQHVLAREHANQYKHLTRFDKHGNTWCPICKQEFLARGK